MLDKKPDLLQLEKQLSFLSPTQSSKQVQLHLRLLNLLLVKYPVLSIRLKAMFNDIHALLLDDYWLKLEVWANKLSHADDVMFRRCLFFFINCIEHFPKKPSAITVFDTNIDLLDWYRMNFQLGREIHNAIECWNRNSLLARSTTRMKTQGAMRCLRLLCERNPIIREKLSEHGLKWFKSVNHFREVIKQNPINDKTRQMESSLFGVLEAYKPHRFKIVNITINQTEIDVTDLAEVDPVIVEQLQTLANSSKFKGEWEHSLASMTSRFSTSVNSIKVIFLSQPKLIEGKGLESFKSANYSLIKKAKGLLRTYQFNELLQLLEQYFGHKIHRHYYIDNLLSFYFEKQKKFRLIDYTEVAKKCPEIMDEIVQIHQSETELLPEKKYGMESLYGRFSKLYRLLINYIEPNFKTELQEKGFRCLGDKNNRIQKAVFQQLQSAVKSKNMGVRSGTSYLDVVRWIMEITDQTVVEAFKISFKRHQKHARRLRVEDLYTDDELKELVFYIEKEIKEAKTDKQLLALYFARIQMKSCWNTSPMSDIELTDIADVALPTSKKSLTVLIQKPRKGYDSDTYSLDGRTVNSVMRDILYVRDTLTKNYRKLGDKDVQNYLFITKEKKLVTRIDAKSIVALIKSILNRKGCSVAYNSMRIRKNGTNHLYREVAKQMRSYESAKLHTFETFIKHYQRVSETKTQQNLHSAVEVMQKYFTGREIAPEIKVLMIDDGSTQKTPTGECDSDGNDAEAAQYSKEHRHLTSKDENGWCSDFLACVWCKHFRTVADPEHVWQLLSYRDYVLADMSASVSDIDNNEFQQEAIDVLNQRVNAILTQVELKNAVAVKKGKELMKENGMHPFWAFAVTSVQKVGDIL